MSVIQEIFDSKFEKYRDKLIEDFLAKNLDKKFSEQGVNLRKAKISEIANLIREGKENEIDFDIDAQDIIPSDKELPSDEFLKNLQIDLSDLDTTELLEVTTDKFKKAYIKVINEASKVLFKQIKSQAFEDVKQMRTERAAFQSRLENFWRKPFILFEIFLAMIFGQGFKANQEYRKICAENPDVVFDVLIKLHARASQIALEVLTLMKAGLADGAHARWRTLHEVTVVALFIEKHGKDVAERYYAHNLVESYKAANQYQQYAKSLKQQQIPKSEMAIIKKEYDHVINRFGVSFKNPYGWASAALNKDNPTLADIEDNVGFAKWRPYYKLASHNVHANPKGISFKLGLADNRHKTMLAGASDYGFADPAHGTAISLLQITSTFLLKKPNLDNLVMADVLKKFERLIGDEFLRIQQKYESKYSK